MLTSTGSDVGWLYHSLTHQGACRANSQRGSAFPQLCSWGIFAAACRRHVSHRAMSATLYNSAVYFACCCASSLFVVAFMTWCIAKCRFPGSRFVTTLLLAWSSQKHRGTMSSPFFADAASRHRFECVDQLFWLHVKFVTLLGHLH